MNQCIMINHASRERERERDKEGERKEMEGRAIEYANIIILIICRA